MPLAGIVLLPFLALTLCWHHATTADSDTAIASPLASTGWAYPPEEIELVRYKKQALQSVSVASGGLLDFDQKQLDRSFLELGIGSGIPLGNFDNILGVTPRFRIDWIDAASQIDVPNRLYDFELQFFYRRPLNPRLSLLAIGSPSIRSDLTTSDNAFRMFALGLLNWECVPDRLTLSAGAVMLGRADLPVLPALGLVWQPNRATKLDLRFPLTKLSYRLAKCGGESETWAYLSGGLGGNTWAVTRRSGQSDELSLRNYHVTAGLERLVNGGGGCFAECGLALGRRLEYEREPSEISLGNAAILQAGWRY